MYIEQVAAKNFKCFASVAVTIPKLTLLTGANSSGKSSLLHALLAPFQSVNFPFYLSPNGTYVNMGDFVEMAHCKKIDTEIELAITINIAEPKHNVVYGTTWIRDWRSSLPRLNTIRTKGKYANFAAKRIGEGYTLDLEYDATAYSSSLESKFTSRFTELMGPVLTSLEELAAQDSNKKPSLLDQLKKQMDMTPARAERLPNLAKLRERLNNKIALQQMIVAIPQLDTHLNFISSFRLAPERTYYERARADNKIGRSGENYIEQIIEWERRKSPEFALLRTALNDLNLLKNLRTNRLRGGRFEVSVKPGQRGVWSNLTDVGFGIGQFMPIVVADLQLGEDSTLVIAQPEIHLHPSVQAALGNYFTTRIARGKKRYIVETHSEYLLNRIRLLIAKGELKQSDVAVYHFQRLATDTRVYPVIFTKAGKIEGAPQDFFDTYMMDVMDIAMNAQ